MIINGVKYHWIDSAIYGGYKYEMYEHDTLGDHAACAVVNQNGMCIGFTYDTLTNFLNEYYEC